MIFFDAISPGSVVALLALFVVYFIESFKQKYQRAVKPFIGAMIFLTAAAGVLEAQHNHKVKAEAQISAERSETQLQVLQSDMRSSLERTQAIQQRLETAQQQEAIARQQAAEARSELAAMRAQQSRTDRNVISGNEQTRRLIQANEDRRINEERIRFCQNDDAANPFRVSPDTRIPGNLGGGLCKCGSPVRNEAEARNIQCAPRFRP